MARARHFHEVPAKHACGRHVHEELSASFACLWTMKRLWGIRVEEETETAGLDVSEHGMWGYPEFYIPVPGGYGTEAHSHLFGHPHRHVRRVPARDAEAA